MADAFDWVAHSTPAPAAFEARLARLRGSLRSEPSVPGRVNHKRSHGPGGTDSGILPQCRECSTFRDGIDFAVPQYGQDWRSWETAQTEEFPEWAGRWGGYRAGEPSSRSTALPISV